MGLVHVVPVSDCGRETMGMVSGVLGTFCTPWVWGDGYQQLVPVKLALDQGFPSSIWKDFTGQL